MNSAKFIEDFLAATDFREPVEVSLETRLGDLPEWDSLAALGVIVLFDTEYGKTITGDDLDGNKTVGDLYGMVA